MARRMSATSRDPEEWQAATVLARQTRAETAEKVAQAIVENDQMSGRGEVAIRVRRLLEAERRIVQALGMQRQAQIEGLPLGPGVRAEREGRETLRAAVMALAISAGGWVAAIDHDDKLREMGGVRPGPSRSGREEQVA